MADLFVPVFKLLLHQLQNSNLLLTTSLSLVLFLLPRGTYLLNAPHHFMDLGIVVLFGLSQFSSKSLLLLDQSLSFLTVDINLFPPFLYSFLLGCTPNLLPFQFISKLVLSQLLCDQVPFDLTTFSILFCHFCLKLLFSDV